MTPEEKEHEELEEEHVKTDKRASREPEPEAEAQAEPEAEAGASEEPTEPSTADPDVPDINVYGLLRMSISMYAEQAWIHLGLVPDPRTKKTEQKLPLAQIAIDTVAFMAEKLDPDLEDSEKREIETLLANLRINYVQRT